MRAGAWRRQQPSAAFRLTAEPLHPPTHALSQVLADPTLADYCVNANETLVYQMAGHELGHGAPRAARAAAGVACTPRVPRAPAPRPAARPSRPGPID